MIRQRFVSVWLLFCVLTVGGVAKAQDEPLY